MLKRKLIFFKQEWCCDPNFKDCLWYPEKYRRSFVNFDTLKLIFNFSYRSLPGPVLFLAISLFLSIFIHDKMIRGVINHGAHLLHLQQLFFLFPKPQSLHKLAGILVLPIHLPHRQQLSFLFPKPQSLQRRAGTLVLPIHFPHLQQLSFLLPKPQLLQRLAG